MTSHVNANVSPSVTSYMWQCAALSCRAFAGPVHCSYLKWNNATGPNQTWEIGRVSMITRRYVGKREGKITMEYEKLLSLLCFVNEFPKTKQRKYQYTSEQGCVIMRKCNRPFIPANDYNEIKFVHNYTASFRSILRVLWQFSFWEFITFSHIPPCFHAKPPDSPRLIGPREYEKVSVLACLVTDTRPEQMKLRGL